MVQYKFTKQDDLHILRHLRDNYSQLYSQCKQKHLWTDIAFQLKKDQPHEIQLLPKDVRKYFTTHLLAKLSLISLTAEQTERIEYPFLKTKLKICVSYVDHAVNGVTYLSAIITKFHLAIIRYELNRLVFDKTIYDAMKKVDMKYVNMCKATVINITRPVYNLDSKQLAKLRPLVRKPKKMPTRMLASTSQWNSCKPVVLPSPAYVPVDQASDSSLSSGEEDTELQPVATTAKPTSSACVNEAVATEEIEMTPMGHLTQAGRTDEDVATQCSAIDDGQLQTPGESNDLISDYVHLIAKASESDDLDPPNSMQTNPSTQPILDVTNTSPNNKSVAVIDQSLGSVVDETIYKSETAGELAERLIQETWSQTPFGRVLLDPNANIWEFLSNEKSNK